MTEICCPMCGSSDSKLWRITDHRGRRQFWIECRVCLHRFVDPVPPDLEIWYETDGYRMTTHHSADPLVNLQEEQKRAERLSGWIYERPYTHLDIGSSTGALLQKANAVYTKAGLELSGARRGIYQDLGIVPYKSLEEVQGDYELITCIHVLEHVIDPMTYLKFIAERTQSYCIIEVPVSGYIYPHLHRFNIEGIQVQMEDLDLAVQVVELTEDRYVIRGHI